MSRTDKDECGVHEKDQDWSREGACKRLAKIRASVTSGSQAPRESALPGKMYNSCTAMHSHYIDEFLGLQTRCLVNVVLASRQIDVLCEDYTQDHWH